jgi:hypothetical protein
MEDALLNDKMTVKQTKAAAFAKAKSKVYIITDRIYTAPLLNPGDLVVLYLRKDHKILECHLL